MGGLKKDGKVVHGTPKGDKTYSDPQIPSREEKHLEEEKTLKEKSFTPLKDSQGTKDRVKELARRSKVGIEQGKEELERAGSQSEIGSEIVADRRAAAAASASGGIQGVTQANKLLQADVTGMAKTAAFEGDLASRDFAAKEDAKEKLSALQVDLKQDEIETSAKELAYDTTQDNHETTMLNNWIESFANANGGRQPTQTEINNWKGTIGYEIPMKDSQAQEQEEIDIFNTELYNKPAKDIIGGQVVLTYNDIKKQIEDIQYNLDRGSTTFNMGEQFDLDQIGRYQVLLDKIDEHRKGTGMATVTSETTNEDGEVVYGGYS